MNNSQYQQYHNLEILFELAGLDIVIISFYWSNT